MRIQKTNPPFKNGKRPAYKKRGKTGRLHRQAIHNLSHLLHTEFLVPASWSELRADDAGARMGRFRIDFDLKSIKASNSSVRVFKARMLKMVDCTLCDH